MLNNSFRLKNHPGSCTFRQTSNLYSGPSEAKASDNSIASPQCSTWSGILKASSAGPMVDLIFGQCKIMEGVKLGLFPEGIKKKLTSGQRPQEGPHQRVLREEGRIQANISQQHKASPGLLIDSDDLPQLSFLRFLLLFLLP